MAAAVFAELLPPPAVNHPSRGVVRIVQHEKTGLFRYVFWLEPEGVLLVERQSILADIQVVAPVRRERVARLGHCGNSEWHTPASARQRRQTQHSLYARNRQERHGLRIDIAPGTELNEHLGESWYSRAGVVLVLVHLLFVAHDGRRSSLSRTEQCRAARLADGEVKQFHSLFLDLRALGPNRLEEVLLRWW